uniref:Uncharacterized protein n=1 Tax=Lactuca sativa TaxID=4236 RepID=A0A9R1VQ34_LACSA|nr:hypothetical protein LSAT_V11C400176360 [Lactuca sativa]
MLAHQQYLLMDVAAKSGDLPNLTVNGGQGKQRNLLPNQNWENVGYQWENMGLGAPILGGNSFQVPTSSRYEYGMMGLNTTTNRVMPSSSMGYLVDLNNQQQQLH